MSRVFISHRHKDAALARTLAEDLKNAGHDVWLDDWKIEPGDSIIAKINEGLGNATHVIVCYSSEGITSPWMAVEWMSTLSAQLEGHGIVLIPAILTPGPIPAILLDRKYANLAKDWASGMSDLIRALK